MSVSPNRCKTHPVGQGTTLTYRRSFSFGLIALFLSGSVFAQELDESRALRLLDVQTVIAAWQEAGPELALPAAHSLDLNLVTADELMALPGATVRGVAAILAYRTQYGRFTELSELNAVDDLPTAEAAALVPFLFVKAEKERLPEALWVRLRGLGC